MAEDKKNTANAYLEFENNLLLSDLVGEHDRHLIRIEKQLGVTLALRGNKIMVSGPELPVSYAKAVLEHLYKQLQNGFKIDKAEIDAAIRMSIRTDSPVSAEAAVDAGVIQTQRRFITQRSAMQGTYIHAMRTKDLVFGVGPAGTGKTYLAVAVGVSMLLSGAVDRIILTRPVVEAGERLGFLPGDLKEKIDPYLRPLYDALYDMMPTEQVLRRIGNGEIEIAPLAYMRGRTLSNAFIILDEAQNTTTMQMKMFLTRLGDNGHMVVTGDPSQIDLPPGTRSGLLEALDLLRNIDEVSIVRFGEVDIMRHHLVGKIVRAYDEMNKRA